MQKRHENTTRKYLDRIQSQRANVTVIPVVAKLRDTDFSDVLARH
jgi:hypothetical protein